MARGNTYEPFEARFWGYVDKRGNNKCWPWKGGKTARGYGQFAFCKHEDINAHVLMWILAKGKFRKPRRKIVMHTCDNRLCVNPKHLVLGTIAENQTDMARKWRTRSKLTAEQVREIRSSNEPYRILAARYGLKSHKTISEIKKRRIFTHLD